MNAVQEHVSTSGGIRFGEDGLIPVVTQDAETDTVLMVAFMNEAALDATRRTERVHYWSRSRGRIWRKGETSGYEQRVDEIRVNCERNSLLLRVRQTGAVCHDGYRTCYYRRLEPNDALTVVEERAFDPAAVYAVLDAPPTGERAAEADADDLAERTTVAYGAFATLRDIDLSDVSATSRRLRFTSDDVSARVGDELAELAGVLDGSHRHLDRATDALLEATQVWYWLLLVALRADVPWERLRPDRALATADDDLDATLVARLLRAEAARWATTPGDEPELPARCHAALALVAQACRAIGLDPTRIVDEDLASLRQKSYLADYFARVDAPRRPSGVGG